MPVLCSRVFKPFGLICYAGMPNSFVISPQGNIMKCTVELYNDLNSVGTIKNGCFELYDEKITKWTKTDSDVLTNRGCKDCVFLPLCMGKCCGFSNARGLKKCPIQINMINEYLELYCDYIKSLA